MNIAVISNKNIDFSRFEHLENLHKFYYKKTFDKITDFIKKNKIHIIHDINNKANLFTKFYCKLNKIPITSIDINENIDKKYMSLYVNIKKYDIPVLMYHRIIDKVEDTGVCYTYTWYEEFKAQMKYLHDHDFKVITFEELDKIGYRNRFNKKYIIITFDDGYKDNYLLAYPILKKYNFPCVVYLVTDETYNKWDVDDTNGREKRFDFLSHDMILEMRQFGCEFGAHTLHHVKLNKISPDLALKEIVESKRKVEELIKSNIISFSYPYGFLNDKVKNIVKNAGFKYGVATDSGSECFSDDLFQIRRIAIFPKNKIFHFRRKVGGAYNFVKIKREKRTIK